LPVVLKGGEKEKGKKSSITLHTRGKRGERGGERFGPGRRRGRGIQCRRRPREVFDKR